MSPEETETLNLRSLTQKLGECTRQVEAIERCYGRGCADCYRTCNLAARLGGRDATLSAPASEAERLVSLFLCMGRVSLGSWRVFEWESLDPGATSSPASLSCWAALSRLRRRSSPAPEANLHGRILREDDIAPARHEIRIDLHARAIRAHGHAKRLRVDEHT